MTAWWNRRRKAATHDQEQAEAARARAAAELRKAVGEMPRVERAAERLSALTAEELCVRMARAFGRGSA